MMGAEGKVTRKATLLVLIMIFLSSCGGGSQDTPAEPEEEPKGGKMAIDLTSPLWLQALREPVVQKVLRSCAHPPVLVPRVGGHGDDADV
jgi:hypothetical protein